MSIKPQSRHTHHIPRHAPPTIVGVCTNDDCVTAVVAFQTKQLSARSLARELGKESPNSFRVGAAIDEAIARLGSHFDAGLAVLIRNADDEIVDETKDRGRDFAFHSPNLGVAIRDHPVGLDLRKFLHALKDLFRRFVQDEGANVRVGLAQASADESVGEIQAEARELAKAGREDLDSLTLIANQADRLIERDVVVAAPSAARPARFRAPERLEVSPARSGRVQNTERAEGVDGPMRRILEPLIDAYPESMTKIDLADLAGYSVAGGGFGNPLGRLRTLGLVDYPQSGEVVALPVLFP